MPKVLKVCQNILIIDIKTNINIYKQERICISLLYFIFKMNGKQWMKYNIYSFLI